MNTEIKIYFSFNQVANLKTWTDSYCHNKHISPDRVFVENFISISKIPVRDQKIIDMINKNENCFVIVPDFPLDLIDKNNTFKDPEISSDFIYKIIKEKEKEWFKIHDISLSKCIFLDESTNIHNFSKEGCILIDRNTVNCRDWNDRRGIAFKPAELDTIISQ